MGSGGHTKGEFSPLCIAPQNSANLLQLQPVRSNTVKNKRPHYKLIPEVSERSHRFSDIPMLSEEEMEKFRKELGEIISNEQSSQSSFFSIGASPKHD